MSLSLPRSLRVVLALIVGSVGGAVADRFGLPLAWMIGAMTTVTAVALAGAPVAALMPLRNVMVAVLGVMLGGAFTPDLLAHVARWVYTLGGLALYCLIVMPVGYLYFRRIAGADPVTAYFSAAPGGLAEMTVAGAAMGGDERAISLAHATRILLVVMLVPVWFRLFDDYQPALRAAAEVGWASIDPTDWVVLTLCGVVGSMLGSRLRIPAGNMMMPMALSAAAHLSGLTESRPPVELIAAAQVVIGVSLGCRFAGARFVEIGRTLLIGIGYTPVLVALGIAFAFAVHGVAGMSTSAVFLAYAPGGVAEMSLVALALSLDVAFVATHHAVRIILLMTFVPLVYRLSLGRRRPG